MGHESGGRCVCAQGLGTLSIQAVGGEGLSLITHRLCVCQARGIGSQEMRGIYRHTDSPELGALAHGLGALGNTSTAR